jgi:hypothetical protein
MDSAPWNQSVSESTLQLRSDEDIYHHMGSIDLETGVHILVRENNLHIELPAGTHKLAVNQNHRTAQWRSVSCRCDRNFIVYWTSSAKKNKQQRRNIKNL